MGRWHSLWAVLSFPLQKPSHPLHRLLPILPSQIVHLADFVRVVLGAVYFDDPAGADHQDFTGLFHASDFVQLAVVHQVAAGHGLHEVGRCVYETETKFGRYVYAVGSNQQAARLTGINVGRVKTLIYIYAGTLYGLAAFLLASRLTSIQAASAGDGYEMEAMAAVGIGGTSMDGGRCKIIGKMCIRDRNVGTS